MNVHPLNTLRSYHFKQSRFWSISKSTSFARFTVVRRPSRLFPKPHSYVAILKRRKSARKRIIMVDAKIKQTYAAKVAQNQRQYRNQSQPIEEGELETTTSVVKAKAIGVTANDDKDADSDIASSGPHSPRPGKAAIDPDIVVTASNTASRPPTPPAPSQPDNQNNMTDEQLYYAKILILDLLGWGVPPEYILDRGVSHKLIHTVFTDLNLRLPEHIAADYAAVSNAAE